MRNNINTDYLQELGYLGFSTRLKRISDALMHEGRRLYSELDLDIEPNWFVIFKLLNSRGKMSVTEISESINMKHPSVIAIINKMLAKDYLISEKDECDSRKRVIDLSYRAIKMLPQFEIIWKAGETALEQAFDGTNILAYLSEIEDVFSTKGFKDRCIIQLNELKN